MTFTLLSNQAVQVVGNPATATGDPSSATFSEIAYQSSDPSVFTVIAVPLVPGVATGAIIKAVGPGSATLTETATATEPDGTTSEKITGAATIIVVQAPPPPPPPPPGPQAAMIVFTFGTPRTVE